jgi:hypothetical protein
MALTNEEKTYLATLAAREGKAVVCAEVETQVRDARMVAILDMASLISFEVYDWEALDTLDVPAEMIYPILEALPAAVAAENGPKVGALLAALRSANRNHFGL